MRDGELVYDVTCEMHDRNAVFPVASSAGSSPPRSRAIATRFPSSIEPEASSTSVTFSGLSSATLAAWNPIRARVLRLSNGCASTSLEIANPQASDGGSYW